MVGLVFWVAADEIGQAATLAAETARQAGAESGVGTELYDVVVIPHAAVADRYGDHYRSSPTDPLRGHSGTLAQARFLMVDGVAIED